MQNNPFLEKSFEIKWSQLTPEHIEPAIEYALAKAAARVQAIAQQDATKVTFENTFHALEAATEEVGTTWGRVTHLQSVADAPALREAHNKMLPKVTSFFAGIPLNV